MAMNRRVRVFMAAAVTAVVIFAAQRHLMLPELPDVKAWGLDDASRKFHELSDLLKGELIPGNGEDEPVSQESPSMSAVEPKLAEDAHKLPNADAFLPHIKAVLQEPGITLAEAKKGCTWGPKEKVDFQYDQKADWVVRDRPEAEIAERRQQWHDFVENKMIPWSKVRFDFEGRGIVMVAGNKDTLMRVKVIMHALVRLGSQIPIEINYYGDEMNRTKEEELRAVYPNTFFNDLSKEHNILQVKKDNFFGINYQLKTAALINSRWAEPILLDSDNIPIIDPATLYQSDQYQEYGTIFWPDIARTWPQNPAWAIFNTPCRMDEYEQESGQLLVDKRRFFYHLQLASWLNNEQGSYYNEFLLGDKDMFRYAWHALRTRFGQPSKWLTSVGTVSDGWYCGHSFAQHHPDDGRIAFLHGGLVKSVDLEVMRWHRETQGGYYRSYKKSPTDEDPAVSIDVGIKLDGETYFPNPEGVKLHGAMCTDFYEVEPRPLEEILPGFEKLFSEIGGYWQLSAADRALAEKPTVTDRPVADKAATGPA